MQYIEHKSAAGVVTYVPVSSCTFRVTDTPVQVTGGNSGDKTNSTRKVTHFSPNTSTGGPTVPAAILGANVEARLGYFNKNGHFHYITDVSVGS